MEVLMLPIAMLAMLTSGRDLVETLVQCSAALFCILGLRSSVLRNLIIEQFS